MESKSCIDTFVERNEEASTADTSIALDNSGKYIMNIICMRIMCIHVHMLNIMFAHTHTCTLYSMLII
jgi:hypothetical protein